MIALPETPLFRERRPSDSIYLSESLEAEQPEWSSSTVIVFYSPTPPLSDAAGKVVSKISGFRNLAPNWDSYGAEKPSRNAIDNTVSFIRTIDAHEIPVYFSAPGTNGEIVVELRKGNYEAEVYFNANNSNEVLIYEGDACISEGILDNLLHQILELF